MYFQLKLVSYHRRCESLCWQGELVLICRKGLLSMHPSCSSLRQVAVGWDPTENTSAEKKGSAAAAEGSLHGLRQVEANKSRGEGDGDLHSLQGSQAAGFHPTCFCNIIFTWVDRTGCAMHRRCVCCGRSGCCAPPGCVLCSEVPWDTLHPEPRLGLQKTDLNCSVHVNILWFLSTH